MRTVWFLLTVWAFQSVWAVTPFQEKAQFWHPDSFHSAYYLPQNLYQAVEKNDSIGVGMIDAMQALNHGEYQKSLELLGLYLNQDQVLKPYLLVYMAQAEIGLKNFAQADKYLVQASAKISSGPGLEYLIQVWLQNKIAQGKVDVSSIRQVLKEKFKYGKNLKWDVEELLIPHMSKAEKVASLKYWMATKEYSAQKYYRSQLNFGKSSLVKSSQWDESLWMDVLKYDFNQAPKNYLKNLKKAPQSKFSSANRKQLDAWKASSYYRTGNFSAAAKLYKKLIQRKQGPLAYHYLQIARSYKKGGEVSKSNYWYGKFQQEFPKHTKTAEMIWTQATKHEAAGRLDKADSLYQVIDTRFTKDKRRKWASFKAALMYYKGKNWKKAADKFDVAITQRRNLWSGNGAYFFKADAQYQSGLKEAAKATFLAAIADFPLSYYAHLSRQHLEEYKLMPKEEIPQLEPLIMSDSQAQAWVRQKMNHKDSSDTWSPQYQAAFERLLQIGAWDAADFLYASSPKKLRWRMDFVLKYSQLYLKYGYLAQSYRLARRLINKMSRKDFASAPMQLFEVVFPKPHIKWIEHQVQGSPVDPLFVLALMRQESIFNDQIFSPVGAAGLMQIMTYTGEPLAKQEGISDRYHKDLLRNPLMAIRLGSRYLVDLHKDWGGEYEYMLANYNAGPKPTARWRKANKGIPDKIAFEQITYWETRDYIKKVMGNYWNYKVLEPYRKKSP